MFVQKNHPYDGTKRAGLPTGPVLEVTGYTQHKPVDGPIGGTIYLLADGSWSFPWNVTPCDEKGKTS